jgi:hypothetical protein
VPPTVLLSGGGYGQGQGLADAADTPWTSDRDGPLGTGHEVLAHLSPGAHRLTLSVPDGLGGTATSFVDVQARARRKPTKPPKLTPNANQT